MTQPEARGDPVLYEKTAAGVALVTLNRPESLNSLSPDLLEQLARVMGEIAADPDVRCVVTTGAGRGFCSGGDVGTLSARHADAGAAAGAYVPGTELEAWEDAVISLRRRHAEIALRLYELPVPTISLVNGPVAGAGIGIALSHDICIASDRAAFITAFARIGRSGDFGSSFFLHWRVGATKARELYFTSERVEAAAALQLGMVNQVYPHEELLPRGTALAERLAAGPRRAHARIKQAMRAADRGDLRAVLEIESINMPLSGRDLEGQQYLQRYLAQRP